MRDDYVATFTTEMMIKDVDLVLDLAGELDVELPLTRQLRPLLQAAAEGGYRDLDFLGLFPQLRQSAGREPATTRDR